MKLIKEFKKTVLVLKVQLLNKVKFLLFEFSDLGLDFKTNNDLEKVGVYLMKLCNFCFRIWWLTLLSLKARKKTNLSLSGLVTGRVTRKTTKKYHSNHTNYGNVKYLCK